MTPSVDSHATPREKVTAFSRQRLAANVAVHSQVEEPAPTTHEIDEAPLASEVAKLTDIAHAHELGGVVIRAEQAGKLAPPPIDAGPDAA